MEKRFLVLPVLFSLIIILTAGRYHSPTAQHSLTGDGYFAHTFFDKVNKKFTSTYGGRKNQSNATG